MRVRGIRRDEHWKTKGIKMRMTTSTLPHQLMLRNQNENLKVKTKNVSELFENNVGGNACHIGCVAWAVRSVGSFSTGIEDVEYTEVAGRYVDGPAYCIFGNRAINKTIRSGLRLGSYKFDVLLHLLYSRAQSRAACMHVRVKFGRKLGTPSGPGLTVLIRMHPSLDASRSLPTDNRPPNRTLRVHEL